MGSYGYLNLEGDVIANCIYGDYADDVASDVNEEEEETPGTIQYSMRELVDEYPISEGLAILKIGDRLGLIDVTGKVVHEDSLYLVYLPGRTKKLTIYNVNYLPLEVDFTALTDNHLGLKGGAIYKLLLAPDARNATTSTSSSKGSRLLAFSSTTPLSKLIVNGKEWKLAYDSASQLLPYGIYDYEAIANDGRRCSGKVELKPSFGSKKINIKF